MKHMKLIGVGVAVALVTALSACSGGSYETRYRDGDYYNSDSYRLRFEDRHPGTFDSDVYVDPYYRARGTGEFHPEHHIDTDPN